MNEYLPFYVLQGCAKIYPSAVSYYVCDLKLYYGRSTILFTECFDSVIRPDCACIMRAAGTMDSSGNVFISEVFSEVMVVISAFSTVLFGVSYLISRTASWSQERFSAKITVFPFRQGRPPRPRRGHRKAVLYFQSAQTYCRLARKHLCLKPLLNGFRNTWT